jgi:hypothetical protein
MESQLKAKNVTMVIKKVAKNVNLFLDTTMWMIKGIKLKPNVVMELQLQMNNVIIKTKKVV